MDRRRQAESNRHEDGDRERKGKHFELQSRIAQPWQAERPVLDQIIDAETGDDRGTRAAGECQHDALGEQLPDDPRLSAADRRPDRDFPATRGCPCGRAGRRY